MDAYFTTPSSSDDYLQIILMSSRVGLVCFDINLKKYEILGLNKVKREEKNGERNLRKDLDALMFPSP